MNDIDLSSSCSSMVNQFPLARNISKKDSNKKEHSDQACEKDIYHFYYQNLQNLSLRQNTLNKFFKKGLRHNESNQNQRLKYYKSTENIDIDFNKQNGSIVDQSFTQSNLTTQNDESLRFPIIENFEDKAFSIKITDNKNYFKLKAIQSYIEIPLKFEYIKSIFNKEKFDEILILIFENSIKKSVYFLDTSYYLLYRTYQFLKSNLFSFIDTNIDAIFQIFKDKTKNLKPELFSAGGSGGGDGGKIIFLKQLIIKLIKVIIILKISFYMIIYFIYYFISKKIYFNLINFSNKIVYFGELEIIEYYS